MVVVVVVVVVVVDVVDVVVADPFRVRATRRCHDNVLPTLVQVNVMPLTKRVAPTFAQRVPLISGATLADTG